MAHKMPATDSPIVIRMRVREFHGVNIWPADPNGSGIRWTATIDGMRLRADTLAEMREMIRENEAAS